jgi:phosphorylcholine metabolism protein LicD
MRYAWVLVVAVALAVLAVLLLGLELSKSDAVVEAQITISASSAANGSPMYLLDLVQSETEEPHPTDGDGARLGKDNYLVSFADFFADDIGGAFDVTNKTISVPSVFADLEIMKAQLSNFSRFPLVAGEGKGKTAPTAAQRMTESDVDTIPETGVPLYPSSIAAYNHPFGTCGLTANRGGGGEARKRQNTTKLLRLPYSMFTSGSNDSDFVRVWPQYPDLRMLYPSEHERCHFVMARMLAIFVAVMKKFGLKTWFMSHATLLGAVRHGGFVPWDVDVDIAMPRSHITYLRRRWRREFPRDMFLQSEKTDTAFHMWNGKERAMRIKDRYSSFAGMRFSVHRGRKKYRQKRWHMGAHIDIIPMEKKSGGSRYKLLHHYFSSDDLFPLQDVCFENMLIPAPKDVHAFLSKIYGEGYMSPPDNVTFGGPTVLPCLATQHTRGSPWSLSFNEDFRNASRPVVAPRSDPYGSYESDLKTPYQLFYNSKW